MPRISRKGNDRLRAAALDVIAYGGFAVIVAAMVWFWVNVL